MPRRAKLWLLGRLRGVSLGYEPVCTGPVLLLTSVDEDTIFVIAFAEDPSTSALSADRFLSVTLLPRGWSLARHGEVSLTMRNTYAFLAPLARAAGFGPSWYSNHGRYGVALVPLQALSASVFLSSKNCTFVRLYVGCEMDRAVAPNASQIGRSVTIQWAVIEDVRLVSAEA